MSPQSVRFHSRPGVLVCAMLGLAASTFAQALTVSVGDSGCNYIGLQSALDELAGQPGPHLIKLRTQTFAVPNGLTLNANNLDWEIRGGHASCSNANPTAGQRSIIDVVGGNNGTALAINANSAGTTRSVILSGVSVRGGSSETGIGANPEGGGLEIRGYVNVSLNNQTRVQFNASGKGGGAYLKGKSDAERAVLWIRGGSRIDENSAQTLGGGVYCDDDASIYHDDGEISFNTADSGGGAYLVGSCEFDSIVTSGSFTGINNNQAENCAGLCNYSSRSLAIRGANNAPFWFLGNIASVSTGALAIGYNGSGRISASLITTVFVGNEARGPFGAAMNVYGGVDVEMRPNTGLANCNFFGVGYGACSAIIDSRSGTIPVGGVVLVGQSTSGANATLTVRNTAFLENDGLSILSVFYGGRLDIEGSLLIGNRVAYGSQSFPAALIAINNNGEPPGTSRLAFSTVVGNTGGSTGAAVLSHDASPMNLRGSILYNPGLVGRTGASTGAITHDGCLLVDASASYPAGPIPPRVGNPNLTADLTASSNSPALDICSSASAPAADYYGRARNVDQIGIPNVYGPLDLGAIERRIDDTIFANGFE